MPSQAAPSGTSSAQAPAAWWSREGPSAPLTPKSKPPPTGGTGTRRAELRPGLTVDIVLKADQSTGELTRGEIEQILTRSPHHPHGIKVRLRGGCVGRVKAVLEDPQSKVRGGQET